MHRRLASAARPARRRYDSRIRVAAAARTRADVVAAAHALLNDEKAPWLTLDEVAHVAGVSRATIYNQFGSRRALLAAVFEDLGRAIGYERVRAAQVLDDPAVAVEATIRAATRCWTVGRVAIRRILALGALDPEIGELNARYERFRRGEMRELAERAGRAGALAQGVTPDVAGSILAMLTAPPTFEQFCLDAAPSVAAERMIQAARALLRVPRAKTRRTA